MVPYKAFVCRFIGLDFSILDTLVGFFKTYKYEMKSILYFSYQNRHFFDRKHFRTISLKFTYFNNAIIKSSNSRKSKYYTKLIKYNWKSNFLKGFTE
ncbi:hypothetical protein BpHYR1_041826 [Brachionus plicatilis]|uniref:Uncharacterized protein n=1 Tax=Brachionus plicatilis TaxID=10195 RepID=A0A3M7PZZ3_BRAPC|nr:hypothetical protein BpHYR1_041826 [Brachionus plicatilis]